MQLVIAAGLALAWGLVGGAVDAIAFSTMEFATPAVALRYAAASAFLVAALSLAGGLGVFALCQLGPGGTAPERRRLALVALQVTAILVPVLLRILPLAHARRFEALRCGRGSRAQVIHAPRQRHHLPLQIANFLLEK